MNNEYRALHPPSEPLFARLENSCETIKDPVAKLKDIHDSRLINIYPHLVSRHFGRHFGRHFETVWPTIAQHKLVEILVHSCLCTTCLKWNTPTGDHSSCSMYWATGKRKLPFIFLDVVIFPNRLSTWAIISNWASIDLFSHYGITSLSNRAAITSVAPFLLSITPAPVTSRSRKPPYLSYSFIHTLHTVACAGSVF